MQEPLGPAFVSAEEDPEQHLRCKQALRGSVEHCYQMLRWLREGFELPNDYLQDADPADPSCSDPLLTLPASWPQSAPTPSTAPVQIKTSRLCDLESARVHSLHMAIANPHPESDQVAAAAAELQALEIRLATAKSALEAWLQDLESSDMDVVYPQPPPLNLYQLGNVTMFGLELFTTYMLEEMQWDAVKFCPAQVSLHMPCCIGSAAACLRLVKSTAVQYLRGPGAARVRGR